MQQYEQEVGRHKWQVLRHVSINHRQRPDDNTKTIWELTGSVADELNSPFSKLTCRDRFHHWTDQGGEESQSTQTQLQTQAQRKHHKTLNLHVHLYLELHLHP